MASQQFSPPLPEGQMGSSTSAVNQIVVEQVVLQDKRRRKRGSYHHYDAKVRLKIAKHAHENGNKSAAIKFTQELGHPVSESSMRNMKKLYMERLNSGLDPSAITSLPHATLGRPLLLTSKLDDEIAEYIRALRLAGGIVNRSIVVASAKGIIAHKNPGLLKEHGGSLDIGLKWAESFLKRREYVKRKATKAARKIPEDFEDLKSAFLERIRTEVQENAIPLPLIFNWDQTGSKLVPVSEWTLAE